MKTLLSVVIVLCAMAAWGQDDIYPLENKKETETAIAKTATAYDSSRSFALTINPLQCILETGLMLEYKPKKSSCVFETGGGLNYVFFQQKSNQFRNFIPGFTVRLGFKQIKQISEKKYWYFEVITYYRQINYKDRGYVSETDNWVETATVGSLFFNGGSDMENKIVKVADEKKQVFDAHFLLGKRAITGKKVFLDYYWGIGVQYKYRELNVTYGLVPYGSSYGQPINPPQAEVIRAAIPSFHLGFKVGYIY